MKNRDFMIAAEGLTPKILKKPSNIVFKEDTLVSDLKKFGPYKPAKLQEFAPIVAAASSLAPEALALTGTEVASSASGAAMSEGGAAVAAGGAGENLAAQVGNANGGGASNAPDNQATSGGPSTTGSLEP